MADVVCLGILVADVVGLTVNQWPDRGKLVLVDRMELHSGGCAANTGIDLAKIGLDVSVIGKVGKDGFGDFLVGELTQNGIDAKGVKRDPKEATSATMVMVHDGGERSFIHYIGANSSIREDDIDYNIIAQSKILHVAGALLMPGFDGEPMAKVLKKAKSMGIMTSIDTAWDSKGRWMSLLGPCFDYIDIAVPSIDEARMLTGHTEPHDIAQAFMDRGVKIVGLKMGEEGCFIKTKDFEMTIPPYKVPAVDANGAGDSFVAGFLAGIVKDWDLEKTGRFANAVGAHCVQALGATTGIKSMDEILAFMDR